MKSKLNNFLHIWTEKIIVKNVENKKFKKMVAF